MNRMDVMARSLAAAAGGKVAATQKVLTDNGVAPYDSKEMNDALGFIKGLVDDGSIHPDTINISAPEARELFAQGTGGIPLPGNVVCIPVGCKLSGFELWSYGSSCS